MTTREESGSNIEPSLIQRVSQGVSYIISGVKPTNFFGPAQPLSPVAQEQSVGRAWDYPVGVNYRVTPRNTEANPFWLMRNLADGYDLLRLVIETRKDQIKSYEWELLPKDVDVEADALKDQIRLVSDFLQMPDREHSWDDWLSMFVEDLLVIDAVAVYPHLNRGGNVMALELIDAATITRKIDETGRTPLPPDPAYQQILHGIMANDLTSDQLVYMMRNPRTNRLYGFSPVEQIMMTVNIALRRQVSQLEFYTAGNVPEAIAQVPETWTPKQLTEFQLMWDSMNEGNTAQRRKMRFVPSLKDITFPKQDVLKDEYDEWLARIVCFAFSIPPTSFVKQQNRATAEQAADSAKEEGLLPLMRWIENKLNLLISRHLGHPELKFVWKMRNQVEPQVQATIDKVYVETKVQTPDEVRERMGLAPLTQEQKDAAWPAPPTPFGASTDENGLPVKPTPSGEEEVKKLFNITVNTPEIHQGDTFVRVAGAEPMTVNVEAPPPANVHVGDKHDTHVLPIKKTRTVRATRQPNGEMLAKIEYEEPAE